ncbi:MAG: hypothetical protein EAY76_00855 [Alphaproteobacteria bacterium]|nr:MAG: hypothetical protein EAY76_00855 [Alphaproteobacteria bacterium]TAF76934.1 MAG: hypothetical protein EAZ52_02095 [Alphaproteobacteria bacterium]
MSVPYVELSEHRSSSSQAASSVPLGAPNAHDAPPPLLPKIGMWEDALEKDAQRLSMATYIRAKHQKVRYSSATYRRVLAWVRTPLVIALLLLLGVMFFWLGSEDVPKASEKIASVAPQSDAAPMEFYHRKAVEEPLAVPKVVLTHEERKELLRHLQGE